MCIPLIHEMWLGRIIHAEVRGCQMQPDVSMAAWSIAELPVASFGQKKGRQGAGLEKLFR